MKILCYSVDDYFRNNVEVHGRGGITEIVFSTYFKSFAFGVIFSTTLPLFLVPLSGFQWFRLLAAATSNETLISDS